MDWIKFENQIPKDGQNIWGLTPSGATVEGKYSAHDHNKNGDRWIFINETCDFVKIVKWATYDVIY